MTLSSSMRFSSKRGFITENHKRGHSFDGRLSIKIKDDDLVLFSDMQMRERDNFLLSSTDDLDDSISKLRYFSDFKHHVPVQAEGNDLLHVGPEKSNYDWLVTPPGTPLFPFLDDEQPQNTQLLSRGRSGANPTVSTSSTEKDRRIRRSAPSPQHGNKQTPERGRSPSVMHSVTTSRRSPTPSNISPMHRRTRSGSHDFRGSLSSWSTARGRDCSSSPKNGNLGSLNARRASASPFTSRSVGSSQSNDHNHFSSMSKGSVTSSCDDDTDSSLPRGMRTIRKIENSVGVRNSRYSSSTYPRRTDQGKVFQRKFGPLLPNAPSNFKQTKSVSRNSSMSVCSNPSSEQGASTERNAEINDHNRGELAAESDEVKQDQNFDGEQTKNRENHNCDSNSSSVRLTALAEVEKSDRSFKVDDKWNFQRTFQGKKYVSCRNRKRESVKKSPCSTLPKSMMHTSSKSADASRASAETNGIDCNTVDKGKSTIIVDGHTRKNKSKSSTLDEAEESKISHNSTAQDLKKSSPLSSVPLSIDHPHPSLPEKPSGNGSVAASKISPAQKLARRNPSPSKCKCIVM